MLLRLEPSGEEYQDTGTRQLREVETVTMAPWQRRIRETTNPISSGLTRWWLGVGRRQVPTKSATSSAEPRRGVPFARAFTGTPSPGEWVVPAGVRPGWEWLPEHGATPNLQAMPRWVRVWYRFPFIDRYAYEWMWWHGGWWVLVPGDTSPPPPDAGVREPRRPRPNGPAGFVAAHEVERS